MSIFDLFFSSSPKIYSAKIDKIPASRFNREVRLTIDGKTDSYKEMKLKQLLMNMARGGVTLTSLEEKLKNMGVKNDQIKRRQEILSILKDECLNKEEDKKKGSSVSAEEEIDMYDVNL